MANLKDTRKKEEEKKPLAQTIRIVFILVWYSSCLFRASSWLLFDVCLYALLRFVFLPFYISLLFCFWFSIFPNFTRIYCLSKHKIVYRSGICTCIMTMTWKIRKQIEPFTCKGKTVKKSLQKFFILNSGGSW